MKLAEAPLLVDPIYGGAADPTVFWNRQEKQWWMVYTQRMHSAPGIGVAPVHGSGLGMASSPDGHDWLYRGTLEGLAIEPGHNTFWAPEILWVDGVYHMYVSYVQGIPINWNRGRSMLHYTSVDGWHWQFQSRLALSSDRVIDACVAPTPEGGYRMWYKDECDHSHTWSAVSNDLYHWTVEGCAIDGKPHEGPNVFWFDHAWWLIADYWHGQHVYRSDDQKHWVDTGLILDQPGTRCMDQSFGNHADVVVNDGRAFIFYFAYGDEPKIGRFPCTAIQVAELKSEQNTLTCDRNAVFSYMLLSEV